MRFASLLTALTFTAAASLAAQAGHPPDRTPYADLPFGNSVTLLGGYIHGDGGDIGVGPHDGPFVGVRYDLRVSGPVQFGFTAASAQLQRLITDPDDSVATRVSGPVDQSVFMGEGAIQFNLAGAKTWKGFGPFLGGGIGFAIGDETPQDTTGYKFGTKFFFVPFVGTRYFVNQHLHLRAEVRWPFWEISYPATYADEPEEEPGEFPDSNALRPNADLDEWTSSITLQFGLGYSFRW
jgi:hypothetical protein